ncbi:MAG: DMT family transporter [Pseudomonadota bacterium]
MENRVKGIGLILLGSLVVSPIGAVVAGFDHINAFELVMLRCAGITAFFVLVIVLTGGPQERKTTKLTEIGRPGLIASVALGTAFALAVYAFQNAPVARVLLLFATAPLQAAVIARLFLNEHLSGVTSVAVALSLVGVVLIVFGGQEDESTIHQSNWGSLAAFIASTFYAIFSVALRAGKNIDMRVSMALSGIVGLVLALVIFLLSAEQIRSSPQEALAMLGVGFFLTGGAFLLYTVGSKSVSAAEFTMISLFEIFLGSLWAWMFLDQGISRMTLFGGALFLIALILNARFGHDVRTQRTP